MALISQVFHQIFQCFCLCVVSLLLSYIPLGRCVLNTSMYGLNAPYQGCQDNWFETEIVMTYESLSTRAAISEPLAANIGIVSPDHISLRFCIWNGTENPVPPTPAAYELESKVDENVIDMDDLLIGTTFFNFAARSAGYLDSWPKGKYCIYNVGKLWMETNGFYWDYGDCPAGFESGRSSYPFEAYPRSFPRDHYHSPLGLYATHGNRTSIEFCCTRPEPGNKAGPISMPFTRPFYLLPVDDTDCQPVRGAEVRLEWIQWPYLDVEDGVHPFVERGPFNNGTKFYMCYYVPNAHALLISVTYIITIGSVVLCISLFLFLGWCNRRRLAWNHSRMVSLQYSGNKNDYV